jgi:hypothetical protein
MTVLTKEFFVEQIGKLVTKKDFEEQLKELVTKRDLTRGLEPIISDISILKLGVKELNEKVDRIDKRDKEDSNAFAKDIVQLQKDVKKLKRLVHLPVGNLNNFRS